ncbi:dipeptide ABC transporter ATP-binding protein [Glutamicibacter uratoxydans]|uniref:dipeptide ABC transporter ATP-binding protein n=1 Tax=Glutamicibacter uratoxydans TaxID=43667 RepID=UPI003D6E09DC
MTEVLEERRSTTAIPQTPTLLEVRGLNVSFGSGRKNDVTRHVVRDVNLHLQAGRCLAIVGESGSGKSVTARTLVGLSGTNAQVNTAKFELFEESAAEFNERTWRETRGQKIGFILQDALVSLDPLRPVGKEIEESLALHRWGNPATRRERVIELLAAVGVPEPRVRAQQRPDQLSGGLRQRALIASAIALQPQLVIADEPTTALDVTVQAQVLELLAEMKDQGTGIILISHDLSVVAQLADEVAVMRGGEIVESGAVHEILKNPRHEYTKALLQAIPSAHTKGQALTVHGQQLSNQLEPVQEPKSWYLPVLEAHGLSKSYPGPEGKPTTVVKDVSFNLYPGQTLGIVGESGSGKSTTAALALATLTADSGTVLLNGQPWSQLSTAARRPRRREVTVVYQDPLSSFDPRWNGVRILTDALDRNRYPHAETRQNRAVELASQVGLSSEHLEKHPLQLSGGQRQRLAIARALAPEPRVVVLDEAVSALDVSVQAQVLDLLSELQQRLGLSYLFISHDLGVIRHMSDQVLVMKDGVALEQGEAEQIFTNPAHPYTRQLLSALPNLEAGLAANRTKEFANE